MAAILSRPDVLTFKSWTRVHCSCSFVMIQLRAYIPLWVHGTNRSSPQAILRLVAPYLLIQRFLCKASKNHLKLLSKQTTSVHWHHNGRYGVSNQQPHDCLLNCLFRCRSKKTSKRNIQKLLMDSAQRQCTCTGYSILRRLELLTWFN